MQNKKQTKKPQSLIHLWNKNSKSNVYLIESQK